MPVPELRIRLEVSPDLDAALRALRDPRPAQARFLRAAGREVQAVARSRFLRGPRPQNLGVRTGSLLRSITVDESGLPHVVEVGTPLVYGPPHEFGATIRPRAARALVFRVGPRAHLGRGEVRTARQVTLPARSFIGPALEVVEPRLEQLLADELEREVLG